MILSSRVGYNTKVVLILLLPYKAIDFISNLTVLSSILSFKDDESFPVFFFFLVSLGILLIPFINVLNKSWTHVPYIFV